LPILEKNDVKKACFRLSSSASASTEHSGLKGVLCLTLFKRQRKAIQRDCEEQISRNRWKV